MERRHFLAACGRGGAALLALPVPAALAATADAGAPYAWANLPFGGGGFISDLLTHPAVPGLVYARADRGGLYRRDAAHSDAHPVWQPLLDGLGGADADLMHVHGLAVDPRDPQRLYAACGASTGEWSRKAALLVSPDRGASWTVHEQDFRLGGAEAGRGSGARLQVDPADGRVLVLGTTRDGLMRSSDGGVKFSALSFPGKHVSLVLFDPAAGGKVLYAGSVDQPGLYASRDGGQHFEREPGTPAQIPQRAAFAPDGSLYVSFAVGGDPAPNPGGLRGGSVWKRSPKGAWTDVTPSKPQGRPYAYGALDVDGEGRVITALLLEQWDGPGDELYLSEDGGAHWQALSSRSEHDTRSHPWLAQRHVRGMGHQIAAARFVGKRLLYGCDHGLWASAELAAGAGLPARLDWRFDVAGIEQARALALHSPSGGVMLFAAMGDGLGGGAWEVPGKAPDAGLFRPCRETNPSVDAAWLVPRVVARTVEGGSGGAVSVDGGASWADFGAQQLVKDARGGHVAVSAKGGAIVWSPPRRPALVSHDRGRTWTACKGWPDARDVDLVPVAEKNVEGVFYVLDIVQGQVLVSVDAGRSFAPSLTGLPSLNPSWQRGVLVSAPGKLRDLWIGLPDALVNVGGVEAGARTIRNVAAAHHIALGAAAPGAAYPSLYLVGRVLIVGRPVDGLFRSDDGGASFQPLFDDRHRFGAVQSLAADPLEYGTVYLATQGRGVLVGRPGRMTS